MHWPVKTFIEFAPLTLDQPIVALELESDVLNAVPLKLPKKYLIEPPINEQQLGIACCITPSCHTEPQVHCWFNVLCISGEYVTISAYRMFCIYWSKEGKSELVPL